MRSHVTNGFDMIGVVEESTKNMMDRDNSIRRKKYLQFSLDQLKLVPNLGCNYTI